MAKIAIISDTHDNLDNIAAAIRVIKQKNAELIIHAGDFCSPYTAFPFSGIDIPLIGVFGNNDGDKLALRDKFSDIGEIFDYSHQLIVDGKKILITHYPDLVESLAKSGDYDFVIFGHTHKLEIYTKGKTTVINPGTLSGDLAQSSTFIVLDTLTNQTEVIEV